MANVEITSGDSRIRKFFRGVRAGWGKIVWPSRETALKQLAAVLIVSVITGLLIVLVDFGSERLINFLLGIGA